MYWLSLEREIDRESSQRGRSLGDDREKYEYTHKMTIDSKILENLHHTSIEERISIIAMLLGLLKNDIKKMLPSQLNLS